MKRNKLGWPFWTGVGFLLLLLLFAIIGPGLRHDSIEVAKRNVYGFGFRFDHTESGAEIAYVQIDTPASTVNLARGDMLTHVDGSSLAGLFERN